MGWLKKFVKWSQKTFIIKWIVGIIFILVGILGIIFPILQGVPLCLMGIVIIVPNKKLHKKLFKHEKLISISLIIGFSILLITPAVLYYYGFFNTGFMATYGRTALDIIQIGQEPIRTAIGVIR